MTVTLKHRTGQMVIKKNVTKYTENRDYITLYFDEDIYPAVRYVKLPVQAYGVAGYKVIRIDA